MLLILDETNTVVWRKRSARGVTLSGAHKHSTGSGDA